MPGYTDSYREGNLVANLADQLADIKRQLRELQKPTGSQKAGAVARLIEAEQALSLAQQALSQAQQAIADHAAWNNSQDADIRGIRATDAAQNSRLDGHDGDISTLRGWNNSQDADIRGIRAKDSAQDSAISTARSVADDAWSRANSAQARADSAYSKAENFENYANPEIVNLTARTVALENRVRRLENFHPSV